MPPAAPAESLAGLITLSAAPASIELSAHDQVQADLVLSNGGVTLDSHAIAAATVEVHGGVKLAAKASVIGSVTTAGTITRGSGATVVGPAVEHALVAPIVLPTAAEFLRRQPGDFGDAAPDLVVPAHRRVALPGGGRRVGRLVIENGARLTISEASALEVTGSLELQPKAELVVAAGGRLLLYATGRVELKPGAKVVQEGAASRDALIAVLADGARVDWSPNVTFGPGLLYAPGVSLAGVADFDGALVAYDVSVRSQAKLRLDKRYLQCPGLLGLPGVTIAHPSGPVETAVAPGTMHVTVSGSVSRDVPVDSVQLVDAQGTRDVALLASGAFSLGARLRTDGEATTVCIVARSCGGQVANACRLVRVRHDVTLTFTSPLPGSVMPAGPVEVIGRVSSVAAPSAVAAGGRTGTFLPPAFYVTGVPTSPGLNLVRVDVTSAGGDTVSVPLVFGVGSLPVKILELAVDPLRRVTITSRTTASSTEALRSTGNMKYRLLDAGGAELHRGRIPGGRYIQEVENDPGDPHGFTEPAPAYATMVTVPAVPGAARIQFLDEADGQLGEEPF